jgi:Domain of unknown function (DUF1876).
VLDHESGDDRDAPRRRIVQIKTWYVELFIFEDDDSTSARAVLHSDSPEHKEAHGRAIRTPRDLAVPEVGDEVAAAAALYNLADVLRQTAAEDILEIEHRSVRLDFAGPTRVSTRAPAISSL